MKYPFHLKLTSLPNGAHKVVYHNKHYLYTKETKLNGKLIKFYAYELGGNDFVSLNFYITTTKPLLKPCEMSPHKVIDFVMKMKQNLS